jgi:serine/threonine-protein kinase
MLYELVTGAPPFTGDSPVSVAYQHVREDPRLPSSINPDIPAELDAILLKAMSKNPANRYQSAADMRNDLLRALAGQRVEATPVMGDAEKTAIIGAPAGGYGYRDDDEWAGEDEHARRRKRRIIAIVSVLAALLLAGVIAVAVALSGDDPATQATAKVQVPALVGRTEAEARQLLTDAKLTVGEVTPRDTDDPAQVGKVLESTPAGGAQVDEGATVALVVGVAPDAITVPDVVGFDEDQAVAALKQAGFTGSINTREVDSLEEEGTVASVSPEAGQQAAPDAPITLGLSSGTIELPDVAGRSEAEARQILTDAGFSDVQISREEVDSPQPPGTVVGTTPGAASPASSDTRIVLQVSGGAADIVIPNVRGRSAEEAEAELQKAGFSNVIRQPTENDGSVAEGEVVNTNPEPGTSAAPDEPITLLIAGPEGNN